MTFKIFCDFDGTISASDVTDVILETFALPEWMQVEEEWKTGMIGSLECMRRQVELLRCDSGQLTEVLSKIEIDGEFPAFVSFCQNNNLDLFIISDGLAYAIQTILQRFQLAHLPIYANRLISHGNYRRYKNRWTLHSPYTDRTCEKGNGVCKCSLMRKLSTKGEIKILIGDGRSDFCAAVKADIVFAKGSLLGHCQTIGLPHIGFQRFSQITEILRIFTTTGMVSNKVGTNHFRHSINGVEIL